MEGTIRYLVHEPCNQGIIVDIFEFISLNKSWQGELMLTYPQMCSESNFTGNTKEDYLLSWVENYWFKITDAPPRASELKCRPEMYRTVANGITIHLAPRNWAHDSFTNGTLFIRVQFVKAWHQTWKLREFIFECITSIYGWVIHFSQLYPKKFWIGNGKLL